MNSAKDKSVLKQSLVCEVMGPAGAGKTTLINALLNQSSDFKLDFYLSRLKKIPYLLSNTYSFLPTYLRNYRESEWFDWRETRSMVYLRTGLDFFENKGSDNGGVTLLDHGPIYRLAFLREFGPEITESQVYISWWSELRDRWIAMLDLMIVLDAPNEILLERIRGRERTHTIKDVYDTEAYEFLNRYRSSFQQIISETIYYRQFPILRYDTNQLSVDKIVDEVLAACNAMRLGKNN